MLKDFQTFGGLTTSVAVPPPNTAKSCANVVLDGVRGEIQQAVGYQKLYDLPVPLAEEKITNLEWLSAHQIYVPNYGGKYVTLAAGKYTRGDYFDGNSPVDSWGVWANPYFGNILSENNSTLETSVGDWVAVGTNLTVSQTASGHHSGSHALSMAFGATAYQPGDGTTRYMSLPVNLVIGQSYVLRFYAKFISGTGDLHYSCGGSSGVTAVGLLGTTFHEISIPFVASSTNEIRIWSSSTTTTYYIDDIELLTWVDDWQELTEFYPVQAIVQSSGSIQIGNGSGATALNTTIFNSLRLKDWVFVTTNGVSPFVISSVSVSGSNYSIEVLGYNKANTGLSDTSKAFIFRNFSTSGNQFLSVPAQAFFDTVKNEARISPGNRPQDFPIMVGFQQKSWGWNNVVTGMGGVYRLICENAGFDGWANAAETNNAAKVTDSLDAVGLPFSTISSYAIAASFVLVDGQQSGIYPLQTTVNIDAVGKKITFDVLVNPAAMPKRARYCRIYVSKDNGLWFYVKDVDLYSGTWTFVAAPEFYSSSAFVQQASVEITNADWQAKGADFASQAGRAVTNSGAIRYLRAVSSGATRFVNGVKVDGVPTPGRIYVSTQSGDGINEWDVFPADGLTTLDVEYNDGDSVLAVGPLSDRSIAFKRRSIVLLLPDNQGGYSRDLLGAGIGMASPDSLTYWNDTWIWCDYNAIYAYGIGGLKVLNESWLSDYKALSDTVKENALGVLDRASRKWRLYFNGNLYVLDLDTQEWLIESLADAPTRFVTGTVYTVDWLSGLSVYRRGGNLQDGRAFSCVYVMNDIVLPQGDGFDILLDRIGIEYRSTIPITITVYTNGNDVALVYNLPPVAKTKRRSIPIPLGSLCKNFHIGISGRIAFSGDSFVVKRLTAYSEEIPAGGDIA